MLSIITNFFSGMIINMIAHKIITLAITGAIGFIIYLSITNPEAATEFITKAKEILGIIKS